jgi:hypothetical protein
MTADEALSQLRAPFPPDEVHLKPLNIKEKRALALPYIDARTVMDRLDAVVGILNWEDDYQVQSDGSVVCQLRVRILGEWIRKTDVGSPSEQPDEGDRLKAAFCLPLDAQALTLDGWTSYDRLKIGDLVLGYDLASGLCRWTPVTAVNVFEAPQDLWSLTSKSFNIVCTPAHRWLVNRRDVGFMLKATDRLDSRDRIVVAAPAESGSHPLTDREAAIVGWLATDGSVRQCPDGRRGPRSQQFHAFIHQSKPDTRKTIRRLLGSDAVEHTTPPGERLFPGHTTPSQTLERAAFRLHNGFAQVLLAKAGLYDGTGVNWGKLTGLITRLSTAARHAMFDAMMAGDGQHSEAGQLRFGKKRKPGVMDAFEVLATLEGIALGTLHSSDAPGHVPLRTLRHNSHTWNKCIEVAPATPESVWCPTTGLGTWVTRWQGQITLTGNSDSLKRAAVKFGVGRYLYSLPKQWLDYDPVKKAITGKYKFRPEDLPARTSPPPPAPTPVPPITAPSPAPKKNGSDTPNTGNALHGRLAVHEQRLVERGYCAPGALFAHLLKLGAERGYGPALRGWDGEALGWAIQEATAWTQVLAKLPLAESQWQRLGDEIKNHGLDPADLCEHFGVKDVDLLPRSQWLVALEYVKQPEPAAAS